MFVKEGPYGSAVYSEGTPPGTLSPIWTAVFVIGVGCIILLILWASLMRGAPDRPTTGHAWGHCVRCCPFNPPPDQAVESR